MDGINLLREMVKDYNYHSELYGDIYSVKGDSKNDYVLGCLGTLNKYITALSKELEITIGYKKESEYINGEKFLYLYIEGDESDN